MINQSLWATAKIQTIKIQVKKLNFPRIRNLPNKIYCEDETGKIEIVYFNSREGYLRKLFPLNEFVIVSGKINYFNKKYQITNPDYVTSLDNQEYVTKNIPKYNLTKGINEKKYRNISEQVIFNLPEINDWLDENFIKENRLINWNECIKKKPKNIGTLKFLAEIGWREFNHSLINHFPFMLKKNYAKKFDKFPW